MHITWLELAGLFQYVTNRLKVIPGLTKHYSELYRLNRVLRQGPSFPCEMCKVCMFLCNICDLFTHLINTIHPNLMLVNIWLCNFVSMEAELRRQTIG